MHKEGVKVAKVRRADNKYSQQNFISYHCWRGLLEGPPGTTFVGEHFG